MDVALNNSDKIIPQNKCRLRIKNFPNEQTKEKKPKPQIKLW